MQVQQLKDLLGAGGLTIQFVFVSACFSREIGEAFVEAGVPHVVCVKVDSKVCMLSYSDAIFSNNILNLLFILLLLHRFKILQR